MPAMLKDTILLYKLQRAGQVGGHQHSIQPTYSKMLRVWWFWGAKGPYYNARICSKIPYSFADCNEQVKWVVINPEFSPSEGRRAAVGYSGNTMVVTQVLQRFAYSCIPKSNPDFLIKK